jgi:hypothetical protein
LRRWLADPLLIRLFQHATIDAQRESEKKLAVDEAARIIAIATAGVESRGRGARFAIE